MTLYKASSAQLQALATTTTEPGGSGAARGTVGTEAPEVKGEVPDNTSSAVAENLRMLFVKFMFSPSRRWPDSRRAVAERGVDDLLDRLAKPLKLRYERNSRFATPVLKAERSSFACSFIYGGS
jgi:hypothetical protein